MISLIACQPVAAFKNSKEKEPVEMGLSFNSTKGVILKMNSKWSFSAGPIFMYEFKQQAQDIKKFNQGFFINFKYEF